MKPSNVNQRTGLRTWDVPQPRGLAWALRWLLVMVLIFDQLSSPFHHHRHDGDIGAGFSHAEVHGLADHPDAFATHVEDDDHDAYLIGHSAMALRAQSASALHGSVSAADALILATAFVLVFPATEADRPVPDWPDRGPPQFTSFKSLPPAGRAPPLHA